MKLIYDDNIHDTRNLELIDTIDIENAYNMLRGGLKSKLKMFLPTFPCNKNIVLSSSGLTIWKLRAEGTLARLV